MCQEELWLYTCNHVKVTPVVNCGRSCPPGTGTPVQGPEADVPCEDCQMRAAAAEIRDLDLGGDAWTLPSTMDSPISSTLPPSRRRYREERSLSPDLPHEPYVTTDVFMRPKSHAKMRGALVPRRPRVEESPKAIPSHRHRSRSLATARAQNQLNVRDPLVSTPSPPRERSAAPYRVAHSAAHRATPPMIIPATPPATPPREYPPRSSSPRHLRCECRDQVWRYTCKHDRTYRVQYCDKACPIAIRVPDEDADTPCPACSEAKTYSQAPAHSTSVPEVFFATHHHFVPIVSPVVRPADYFSMLRDTIALRVPSYTSPSDSYFPDTPVELEVASPVYFVSSQPRGRSYSISYEYEVYDRPRHRRRLRRH